MHRVIAAPKLLIIDEIGYLPFGREQANGVGRRRMLLRGLSAHRRA